MNKIYLIIVLCLSMQGCSTLGSASSVPTILDEIIPDIDDEPSGLETMAEVLIIMGTIKVITQ
ncbi:MAG: hypothetical protein ACI88H_000689 [Cocleimonas sp.]|jgi:hypothetical protein